MPPDGGPSQGDSVEHEVLAQHRRLDVLFAEALEAFSSEDPRGAARSALVALRAALETHFDQEGELYYPAIWALRPDLKPELQGFLGAHGQFQILLERIEGMLSGPPLAEARSALEAFFSAFKAHEVAEEATLATLEREIGGG